MRNHVKCLLLLLSAAALSSFSLPDRDTSGLHDVTTSDTVAVAELFNEKPEIVLPNGGGNPSGTGTLWLLAAKKDDNGKNDAEQAGDAEEDKEEKDDKVGGRTGFDRLWDVTCSG
jgi:hypothetical protein